MSNPTSVIDFDVTLADFLATAVSDGTWDDILDTLKFDEVGNEAAATEVDGAGGQLWSNMVDDYIITAYPNHYKATKTWRQASLAALQALGSDDSLAVDDIGYTEDTNDFYYCTAVSGPSVSTWTGLAISGPVEAFYNTQQNSFIGDHAGALASSSGGVAYIEFAAPVDLGTVQLVDVIIIPTATDATADIDIDADFGTIGETYNNTSGSITAPTYNLTINQIFNIDISGAVATGAAGDFIGIKVTNNSGNNILVLGARLRYLRA
jgi:hypothetical protein